jgi:DHA1 family inner membrane transport protein
LSDTPPAGPGAITPPSLTQTTLALTVGSVGLLMLGLQPLLLGAMVEQGRLTNDQLGLAATAELLTLGLAMAVLAGGLKPTGIKLVNALGCAVLAVASLGSILTAGYGFVASRALAGLGSALLVWIAVVVITRNRAPDRVAGVFLTVQTLAQAGLAALLPLTAMVRWGVDGGLGALGVIALATLPASLFLQDRFAVLPKPASAGSGLPIAGLTGLVYMAGIVGLWVFVERLGTEAGATEALTGIAVAAALAAQVTGSAAATFLTGRLPTVPVLALCAAGNIGLVALLGAHGGPVMFVAGVVLFGFLWLFALPFQTRLLIRLGSSRRSAMLLSAAQLLGGAVGPLVTAAFATEKALGGALMADAGLFALGLVVTAILRPGALPLDQAGA